MISRYEVTLNNRKMSALSPKILITDIQYGPYNINDTTFRLANFQGVRLHDRHIAESTVTISFIIREYDIRARQEICSQVAEWAANGGTLETNDRNKQVLHCVMKKPPVITSALRWTDTLQVTFAAYTPPFWEDTRTSGIPLSGTSGSGRFSTYGNVPETYASVKIGCLEQLSSISLTLNGRTLSLTGLSVPAGGEIDIGYDENLVQYIKNGDVSLLDKRSGADDLIARCCSRYGPDIYNYASFTSSATVAISITVKGLWL